jgi:hypothetical protein
VHYADDGTRKPSHVFDELERLFKNKRHEQLRILELGVHSGASLLIWRDYFPRAIIVGIDTGPMPELLRGRGIEVVRGHQDDPEPLALACKLSGGAFDLIIGDCAPTAPIGSGPTFEHLQAIDDFARGTVDAMRQIIATLIGREIVNASDLQEAMDSLANFWREKECPKRTQPAQILAEALGGMAAIKREADANIFKAPAGLAPSLG